MSTVTAPDLGGDTWVAGSLAAMRERELLASSSPQTRSWASGICLPRCGSSLLCF